MIRLSVLYPKTEGASFDHDYYRDSHVPLAVKTWGVDRVRDRPRARWPVRSRRPLLLRLRRGDGSRDGDRGHGCGPGGRRELHDHHPRATALRGRRVAVWFVAHERRGVDQGRAGHGRSTCSRERLESDPDGEYLDVCGDEVLGGRRRRRRRADRRRPGRPRRRAGRPGRHAHRELDRGDAGLVGDRGRRRRRRPDQHRLQGRVPAPPARRLGRSGAARRADLADRAERVVDEIPSSQHVVVLGDAASRTCRRRSHRWDDLLGRRPARRSPTSARATWRRSSTPAAPPARRRAACSATATTRRCPARSGSAGGAPPTTSCGRRCRCSTSTPSSPRCSARWSTAAGPPSTGGSRCRTSGRR